MGLSRQTMLERMRAKDAAYDGRFLTGVLSTGIYCLPSCKARTPNAENVRFFADEEAARAAGLRPCKRCRPEDFYRRRDPDRERVEALVSALRRRPADFAGTAELARAAQMGASKLHALLRRHFHTTPARLLSRARVAAAQRLLLEADRPVSTVAFDVGFESLSSFNDSFRRHTAMTPAAWRRLLGAREFELRLPARYPVQRILGYFGRDPGSRTQRARGEAIELGCWLPAGGDDARSVPAALRGRIGGGRVQVEVTSPEPLPEDAAASAHGVLLRVLGLTWDPAPFERRLAAEPRLGRLIAGRPGLRMPLTTGLFEGLVWAIVGQQINLPFAFTLYRQLVNLAGHPLDDDREGGLAAPPRAAALAVQEPEELARRQFSRRKIEYLLDAAAAVAAGELPLARLAAGSASAAEETLLARRGLGPWSVNYLMMRSFGFEDCVPVGDAGLVRGLERFFGLGARPDAKETLELMRPFAPYRSLATFHLWQSLEEESP